MRLTTIITSFNSKDWISGAIDSFLAQDYDDKELIIFDGISTDETHEIIKKAVLKNSDKIKWIQEKDSGISDARNKAIKHSTGDYIGFLGADDRLLPGIYKKINEHLSISLFEEVDVIYFDSYLRYKDDFYRPRTVKGFFSSQIPLNLFNLLYHIPIAPGEAFYYNKKTFESINFNVNNKNTMDYEFNLELLYKKEKKIKTISIPFFGAINYVLDGISAAQGKKQQLSTIKLGFKYALKISPVHTLIPAYNMFKYLIKETFFFILNLTKKKDISFS